MDLYHLSACSHVDFRDVIHAPNWMTTLQSKKKKDKWIWKTFCVSSCRVISLFSPRPQLQHIQKMHALMCAHLQFRCFISPGRPRTCEKESIKQLCICLSSAPFDSTSHSHVFQIKNVQSIKRSALTKSLSPRCTIVNGTCDRVQQVLRGSVWCVWVEMRAWLTPASSWPSPSRKQRLKQHDFEFPQCDLCRRSHGDDSHTCWHAQTDTHTQNSVSLRCHCKASWWMEMIMVVKSLLNLGEILKVIM